MNKLLRNTLLIASIFAIIAFFASYFIGKQPKQLSPQTKAEYLDEDLIIKVVYCQPSKKGRLIFGKEEESALQPFGKYWRLGANEATTIEINRDLFITNKKLPKGKYSLYAVPGKETWKLGINKVFDRWGASEPDYSKDVFSVLVPVTYTDTSNEQFTITISQNSIDFWWDTSKVIVPFEVLE